MLLKKLFLSNLSLSVFITLLSFYSVIFQLNEKIIGKESESTSGILIWTYKMADPNLNNFPKIVFDRTGYPFGENIFTLSDITQIIPRSLLVLLQLIFESIVSYNIFILIIFFLNFFYTSKLISYFTRYKIINFIFTFMLTYSNYNFAKLSEHVIYTMQFLVAISFILTIEFLKNPKLKNFYFFITFYLLSIYFDGYYPFILLPFFATNMIIFVKHYKKISSEFKESTIKNGMKFLGIFSLVIPISYFFIYLRESNYVPKRTVQDFQGFSGKIDYLWKFNDLHPLVYLGSLPSRFLPDSIAQSESTHFSLIQLLIVIVMISYLLIFKIFSNKIKNQNKYKYNHSVILFIFILILFCFVFFINVDIEILNTHIKTPSELLFRVFPYWRVTSRGLIVLVYCISVLAIILIEPIWDFKNKKYLNNLFLLFLILSMLFQTGFHPVYKNYSITQMNYNNIFQYMKLNGLSNKPVSLSSWNEFTGYGMWIAYSEIKVPNNFFEYSNFTSFYENSMSYLDPQFLCHQKFIESKYLAFLDVPISKIENFEINNYKKMAIFKSTRNPNHLDILFELTSKIRTNEPRGFPSFERTHTQILNKDFSLFVIRSSQFTVKIKPILSHNSNISSIFSFGISTKYYSNIKIKKNNEVFNFNANPDSVLSMKVPVKLGDEMYFTSTPIEKLSENVTYISSPNLKGC